VIVLVLLVMAVLAALPASAAAAELPLGPAALSETRTTSLVAPGVSWTRITRSGRGDGPFRVNVLLVDRTRIAGRLASVLSDERIPGLERTSTIARRRRALAGVNGGYFNGSGDPVGVLAVDGRLVSETVGARTAMLIPREPGTAPRIAPLRFTGSVTLAGRRRVIDGVDRRRGRIPGCGGLGGDRPTERPNEFITCTDSSELVVLSPRWGARTGTGPDGVEVVVRRGAVTSVRRGGDSAIPSDGYVLSGSGDAAGFLAAAVLRSRPGVDLSLVSRREVLRPEAFDSIAGAGPRLLAAGRISVTGTAEAITRSNVVNRVPRTLAGVRADGRVLLVTIDGRQPRWSAGATMLEAAKVMRALGAREALNLDGGGSATMVVGRRVVNRPSDGFERAVSDGLFVLP